MNFRTLKGCNTVFVLIQPFGFWCVFRQHPCKIYEMGSWYSSSTFLAKQEGYAYQNWHSNCKLSTSLSLFIIAFNQIIHCISIWKEKDQYDIIRHTILKTRALQEAYIFKTQKIHEVSRLTLRQPTRTNPLRWLPWLVSKLNRQ